jgi:hypothetical protein
MAKRKKITMLPVEAQYWPLWLFDIVIYERAIEDEIQLMLPDEYWDDERRTRPGKYQIEVRCSETERERLLEWNIKHSTALKIIGTHLLKPGTYPKGTTEKQWDRYRNEALEFENRMRAIEPSKEEQPALWEEWFKSYSMDAPNKPGYYRANND